MKTENTPPAAAGKEAGRRRTLILLTYNEIEGATYLFDKVPWQCADEAFAVDGGSKDGTVEFLRSKGLRVVGQDRRGRGRAFQIGMETAKGENVVFFSSDGNEDPADIPVMFKKLEEGSDLVIASRMMKGAFNEEDVKLLRPRKWVNLAFTFAVNALWNRGPYISDTINGFRGITRSAFTKLKCNTDGFDIEFLMTIRAVKLGIRTAEIPTREGARIGGVSTAESWPTGMLFVKRLLNEIALGRDF
ncbi:MAG: glycosyltransferase family 2 protein [Elusimicrobia bacterium]|nr:glycosyltransferase family 2 protein [Elusimicrobiota bacterium]